MRAIKNIRLKHYDYSSDGYYFVTICTDYLKPYLAGSIKSVVAQFIGQMFGPMQDKDSLINLSRATCGEQLVVSEAEPSRTKSRDWATTGQKYIPGVSLDWHVIMPTHIHLILILENCNLTLGEIVRRFKAKTSKALGFKVWQPNYYEHVIRNEAVLNRIREYIQNNPMAIEIEFEEFYKEEPNKLGNYGKIQPNKLGNYKG